MAIRDGERNNSNGEIILAPGSNFKTLSFYNKNLAINAMWIFEYKGNNKWELRITSWRKDILKETINGNQEYQMYGVKFKITAIVPKYTIYGFDTYPERYNEIDVEYIDIPERP